MQGHELGILAGHRVNSARVNWHYTKEVAGHESLQEAGPLFNDKLHEPCMQGRQGRQVFLEATHRLVYKCQPSE